MFVTNRSLEEKAEIRIRVRDRAIQSLQSAELLTGPDGKAENTFDAPDHVRSRPFDEVQLRNGQAVFSLPPLSFLAATFGLDPA